MTGTADTAAFEQVLEHLQQTRGFDFTAYKRTTLLRRMMRRMQIVDVASFDEYLDYLQVHPEEFAALFNAILINVTSFFRDAEVWTLLKERVLPELLDAAGGRPIRIWSAGCASGQEPYSLAMLLAEQLGMDAFRERVKIYATDADEEALAQARAGAYPARQVGEVPADLLAKYFEHVGSQCVVNRELRRSVIFGRHDLLLDAPISRVDLLLCRNTLMYFQAEAQARILARFYFALNPGGLIILGRAEMLFSHTATFAPLDLKRRLFRALPKPRHQERLLVLANGAREPTLELPPPNPRLQDIAFESDASAQIVVDASGTVVAVSASARAQFGIAEEDIGRPLQDLEISYRPAELRTPIALAIKEQREVILKDVDWALAGTARTLRIRAVPLMDDHAVAGVRVLFQDVTEVTSLQNALVQAKQELDTAYEELQSTNEELETTNEELQSAVEELETTNEELQSTNEELETMNEELQSTNEELQTMNDELRSRGSELNSAKSFLESIFTSLRSAVVVLDHTWRVTVWNDRAADLWGVRQDEAVGTLLPSLDIGLPVEDLRTPIHEVLGGKRGSMEVSVPATSRKGRSIECRVSLAPLAAADRSIDGVILLIEELPAPTV